MSFFKKVFGKGSSFNEPELLTQIDEMCEAEKHQEIIDLVDSLPKAEQTPDILSEQARAYNNLYWEVEENDEKSLLKAIEILKSIEMQQGDSPIWNYRIGYSYFFLNDLENAKKYLEKGDKEKGADLLEVVEKAEAESVSLMEAYDNLYGGETYFYEQEEMEALEDYIDNSFGKVDNVFHELVSPDIHCDVYIIEPTPERNFYTLVTGGMGAYTMNVPEGFDGPTNAELMIHLPADWDVKSEDDKFYWPIGWLKTLARLPINQDTFLAWGHTIPTGEALPDTDFRGFMLVETTVSKDELAIAKLPTGKEVVFYQLVPIYEEEMYYKLENEAGALLDLFQEANIPYPPIVDVQRPNVCLGFQPTQNSALLDNVYWAFNHEIHSGLMPFFSAFKSYNEKLDNNIEDFNPFATIFHIPQIRIIYDAWIKGKEDLQDYEKLTDESFLQTESENGFYQCRIISTFQSMSGDTFGALELLFAIHNTLANKELGDHVFFEGFDLIGEEEDGTPILYLMLGS